MIVNSTNWLIVIIEVVLILAVSGLELFDLQKRKKKPTSRRWMIIGATIAGLIGVLTAPIQQSTRHQNTEKSHAVKKTSSSSKVKKETTTKPPRGAFPDNQTILAAWKEAKALGTTKVVAKNQQDAAITYQEILDFKNPTKYTGTVQTVSGEVFQVRKGNPSSPYYNLFVDASSKNETRTYIIAIKPKKPVTVGDTVSAAVIVAGPAAYPNKNGGLSKAIVGVALTENFIDEPQS